MPMGPASGGGGGKSGDVRAGGAYVEISAKDQLSKTLLSLKAKFAAFSAGLTAIGKGATVIGGSVFAPLAALFKGGVGRAEDIAKGAEQLGLTVEQYQRVKFAADAAAVSVEDVMRMPEKYAGLMAQAPMLDAATIKEAVAAQQQFRGAIIHLQSALAPLVSALVPVIRAVAEFVKRNPELARVLFTVAAAATVLGPALMLLGSVVLPLLSAAFGAVVVILGSVAAKVAAVAVGVGYLAAKAFPETAAAAGKFFGEMLDIATDTVGGIVKAIGQGNFGLAMELAIAGALSAWKRLEAGMTYIWTRVKDVIVDTFRSAINEVKKSINDLAAWILRNDPTGWLSGDLTDEEINAARDEINNEYDADTEKRKKAAREFRDRQIADADQEAADARKKLDDLLRQVDQKRPDPGGGEGPIAQRITATRGAFRLLGDASQQFGRVSIDSMQLEEMKKMAKSGELQLAELKRLNAGVESLMRFH